MLCIGIRQQTGAVERFDGVERSGSEDFRHRVGVFQLQHLDDEFHIDRPADAAFQIAVGGELLHANPHAANLFGAGRAASRSRR